MTFLTRKGNGILITLSLNSVTTLKKENLKKKANKTIIITATEENSKDRGRSRSSSEKGTNNQTGCKTRCEK